MFNAQRFIRKVTLQACVDDWYRMMQGESDADAVRLLRSALLALGYEVAGGPDGDFGSGTATAVSAFKTDEGPTPTDPVASSRGTVGRLDAYFAHEPADPDVPNPPGTAWTWSSNRLSPSLSRGPPGDRRAQRIPA